MHQNPAIQNLPFPMGAPPLQSENMLHVLSSHEAVRTITMQGRHGGIVVVIVAFCEAVSLTDVTCHKHKPAA